MAGKEGLKQVARDIFSEGLRAADPLEAVHRHFRLKDHLLKIGEVDYFLNQFKNIWALGAGKASARMAQAVEETLGERVAGGLVIVKYGHGAPLKKISVREAGHPVPDAAGLTATAELFEFSKKIGKDDLVIVLISGGGSSLLVAPAEGISLSDKQAVTEAMLKSGMTIEEINAVRKHLSRVKAGRLAQLFFPATVISLVLSDVIGDQLEVIASGPTIADPSTYGDAVSLLKSHQVWDAAPDPVRQVLERGVSGRLEETPKPGDQVFTRVQNLIVGGNRSSLESCRYAGHKLGFNTLLLSSVVTGEARELGKFYGAILREIVKSGNPVKPPACIILGGEPTVTVQGKGKGGRSQELALATALEIEGLKGALFLAAGTDGTDGPTEAAGAIADGETIARAKSRNMDPQKFLAENDSYNFFSPLGDLIITGPTGTNVMDIHLLLVG